MKTQYTVLRALLCTSAEGTAARVDAQINKRLYDLCSTIKFTEKAIVLAYDDHRFIQFNIPYCKRYERKVYKMLISDKWKPEKSIVRGILNEDLL